jgi:hypothetical protein
MLSAATIPLFQAALRAISKQRKIARRHGAKSIQTSAKHAVQRALP